MSLWKKGVQQTRETAKSDELVRKRGELEKKYPEMMKKWEEQDAEVLKMASEMSVAQYTANPARILQARENLKQSIWRRDAIREGFQHQSDELNGAIEALTRPTIFSTVKEWTDDLLSLKDKKIVEPVSTRWAHEEGKKITFKSNIAAIVRAKEILSESIAKLRSMQWEGLSAVTQFIQKTESILKGIDFDTLIEGEEVSEWRYQEIISEPEVKVYPIGTTFQLIGDKILKTYK